MPDQPHILILLLDTARADAFEPYGAPIGSTPAMRQLADTGTWVPLAYATAPWTVPSHLSMFSGLLPSQAGLRQGGGTILGIRRAVVALRAQLLPEVLRSHGYRTVGISSNLWVSPMTGFDVGFDEFHTVANPRSGRRGPARVRRATHALNALRAHLDTGAAEAGRLLFDAHNRQPDRPFFGFVNLMECHSPYLPPKPFNPLSLTQRVRSLDDQRRYCTFDGFLRTAKGAEVPPDETIQRLNTLYTGCIRLLDSWVAQVLERLDDSGLLADTQVIVTSDHGESLGEGGRLGHHFSLEERLLRIPFVSAGPLDLGFSSMLSLTDLRGAIMSSLGLGYGTEVPRRVAVAEVELPVVLDVATSEQVSPEAGAATVSLGAAVCAVDGSLKLVSRSGTEVVHDLNTDPLEQTPLPATDDRWSARQPSIAALRAALDDAEASVPAHPADPASPFAADDSIENQMRLLGYI